ncbi:transcriptional regulator ATRX homolog isoform X2 [Dermatophagoides pteronyssinus]|uniref:transcriptional regulator ATRX homolog isoform X2 n=1 Tax=Dermatophagoides pteronyssinus TaxID=6956 RepID=UPI003F667BA4
MDNFYDYRNDDDYPSDYESELKKSQNDYRKHNRQSINYVVFTSDEDDSDDNNNNDDDDEEFDEFSLVERFDQLNLSNDNSSNDSAITNSSSSSSQQTINSDIYLDFQEWFTEDESNDSDDTDGKISDESNDNVKDESSKTNSTESCTEKRNFEIINDDNDDDNDNQRQKRLKLQNIIDSNQCQQHETTTIEIIVKIDSQDHMSNDDSLSNVNGSIRSSNSINTNSTGNKTSDENNNILVDRKSNSVDKQDNDNLDSKHSECKIPKNETTDNTDNYYAKNVTNFDTTNSTISKMSSIHKRSSNQFARKRIREIYHHRDLNLNTQIAIEMEDERTKRIMEKNRLLDIFAKSDPNSDSRVILEFDPKNEKVLLEIDQGIVKILKPHQRNGIRFMYDCTIETFDRLSLNDQSGCILAHSMGLGKTLQVVAFLQAIMNNPIITIHIRKVLIIIPFNVQKSWIEEFSKWKNEYNQYEPLKIYDLSDAKTIPQRIEVMKKWNKNGGIFLLTINMFRNLIMGKSPKLKPVISSMEKYLLNPGPDMVIFDEGHLLKSNTSQINQVASKIRTLRRIILTGTPMQNNLGEFYVMVDFIKPNLLGTIDEFRNRFENPIKNGQHIDSTSMDVARMKKRAFVLHKMLSHCINRCNYKVLVPFLPPKYEYVLYLRLSSIQSKLYRNFIDNLNGDYQNLLGDFWKLSKLNNHPILFLTSNDEDFGVNDDNNNNEEDDDDDNDDNGKKSKKKSKLKTKIIDNNDDEHKITVTDSGLINDEEMKTLEKIESSVKFTIAFAILDYCQKIGDKLLIFSQSLRTLDLIEKSLKSIKGGEWKKGIDYFRIDGQVKIGDRVKGTKLLNDRENKRARLMLISTRAGGIGINLVGANRCIIFDCSWNPANDVQALFRVFRFGQLKPVYIYRLAGYGTMENRIYQRQISKQSISGRVVDLKQIRRYFTRMELEELYTFIEKPDKIIIPNVPDDQLLAKILKQYYQQIISYHDHDSLLENLPEEQLTNDEKIRAWIEWKEKSDENPIQNNNDKYVLKSNNNNDNKITTTNDPPKIDDHNHYTLKE